MRFVNVTQSKVQTKINKMKKMQKDKILLEQCPKQIIAKGQELK